MKRNFCVIDTETRGLSARPESFLLGCVYGYNDYGTLIKKHFLSLEEMLKYLFNQDDFKYIFAHNAEYDFTVMFDNIILNLDNEALFVGSMFIKAKKDGLIFMNSLAILKSSAEQLGKALGIEKLILDEKFKKGNKNITITEKDIKYCFRDCEIIYDYLEKIFDITGKMKPTIASCAMEIFLKDFLHRKFERNEHNEKFRESYYGGRVECFRFGKVKDCKKYDVNSIYPFVSTDMYFPDFNKVKKGRNINKKYFQDFILKNYEGCVNVKVHHNDSFVGTLPYRKENEIIYPVGTWTAWYNFNELRRAIESGLVSILDVKEYYYAPRMFFKELSDYMKFFYQKKETTKGAEKLLYKFILNSLTGKFAQKEFGKKRYFISYMECMRYMRNNNLTKCRHEVHHFSEDREDVILEWWKGEKGKNLSRWNIPTISSYITSQARILMLDFYLKYKDHLLYTDTDSLVLTCPIEDKYIGTGLGKFKLEDDNEIEIFGNKHYSTKVNGKKVNYIKGVHKKHTKRGGKFIFKKMIRTKEGLRRIGIKTGKFVTVRKTLSLGYTKRIVKNTHTKSIKLDQHD